MNLGTFVQLKIVHVNLETFAQLQSVRINLKPPVCEWQSILTVIKCMRKSDKRITCNKIK